MSERERSSSSAPAPSARRLPPSSRLPAEADVTLLGRDPALVADLKTERHARRGAARHHSARIAGIFRRGRCAAERLDRALRHADAGAGRCGAAIRTLSVQAMPSIVTCAKGIERGDRQPADRCAGAGTAGPSHRGALGSGFRRRYRQGPADGDGDRRRRHGDRRAAGAGDIRPDLPALCLRPTASACSSAAR